MKGNRLKTLGFALAGGLALLFAGCGQQAGTGGGGGSTGGGGSGTGAVTSVGISPQLGAGGTAAGILAVKVTLNEGAQVKTIVAKVDGQQVNQITVQGLRPQALEYTITVDTAQLDPNTKQPKFPNGTHTLTVEVTDVNNNTKSASTQVIFRNNDYVRGLIVSQTDNPKAPVTVGSTKWYGNGDVFVTVDIVNYSGATYTISGSSSPFTLSASGGAGGSLASTSISVSGASAAPVSGQPQLKFAKSSNALVSGSVTVQVGSSGPSVTFGLDNAAPNTAAAGIQVRKPLLDFDFVTPSSPSYFNSQTLFRGTGATDTGGVGGLVYTVEFAPSSGVGTSVTATLPGDPSAGVTVSGLTNGMQYNLSLIAVEDALGNKNAPASPIVTYPNLTLADATITLSGVSVSNTNPSAGSTFNVSATASGGVGSTTTRVALKLGTNLVDYAALGSVTALAGAQYVVYAVDSAGNYVVQDLGVTVSQPASDKTAPSVTLNLPSTAAPSGGIAIGGSVSDDVTAAGSISVSGYQSQATVGGYTWFLSTVAVTNSSGTLSGSATAPNHVGPHTILVRAWDNSFNLGFATGTVNVQ
ncbi:hypothetical protein [Thermus thermophilus]|uniref:hypothetical protein n=1 Tax=Thermus thermophilus TaxID=274 RepID=UPI001FCAF054|nr:hypothetical protein [Thermus thermophilus]BDG24823.1 hypothetical protein TthSNM33_20170 [Thermus thermophilus]